MARRRKKKKITRDQLALFGACRDGDLEILKDLILLVTNVNFTVWDQMWDLENFAFMTPLYIACLNAHHACVDLLLVHGANVNAGIMRWGVTPLMATAHKTSVEFIENRCRCMNSLLDAGAGIDKISRTELKFSALMCAGWNFRLTKVLLNAGANLNIVNKMQCTILTNAIIFVNNVSPNFKAEIVEIVELLMQSGADIDSVDFSKTTVLHWACYLSRPVGVDMVLLLGADIDMVNYQGKTALQAALSGSYSSDRLAVLQKMATCSQTRLEASSAEWIRLAQQERNRFNLPQIDVCSMDTAKQQRRRK